MIVLLKISLSSSHTLLFHIGVLLTLCLTSKAALSSHQVFEFSLFVVVTALSL